MTQQELTWHYRVWHLLILLALFTILLSDRFQTAGKLDRIYEACTAYTIDLGDLKDLDIEDVELDETK